MSINDCILRAAGLTDPNIKFTFFNNNEFNQFVRSGSDRSTSILYKATLSVLPEHCPNCGHTIGDKYYRDGVDTCRYALPAVNGYKQLIDLEKQRFLCRQCWTSFISESSNFIEHNKVSRPLLAQIIDLAKRDLSQKNIAHILHLSPSKVHSILKNAATAYKTDYERKLPETINVDEFKYAKNHYAFEMIDATTSDLIELFPERTNHSIEKNLSNYSLKARRNVKLIVTDMNASYPAVLKRLFPNAEIVIDRFHIVQLAMKAVQSVRTQLQKNFPDRHHRAYRLMKSNWKFFLKDRNKLDLFKQRYFWGINEYMYPIDALKLAFSVSPEFESAYETYQTILSAQRNQSFTELEVLITNYKPMHSPMDTVITTYKKNIHGIHNAFINNVSNGRIEGINRRIKQIGRTAYGYRKASHYFFRIRLQLFNRRNLSYKFIRSFD
jgi:transposase